MSRLNFFLTPDMAFDALRHAKLTEGSRLIIRRFSKDGCTPGMKTVDLDDDNIASIYTRGKYCLYYLSLGSVPKESTDWGFTERAADELLEFEGGRLESKDLEMTKLRIFSKKSLANANFRAVKRAISKFCDHKGVVTLSGENYPKVLLSTEVEKNYRLWLSLGKESDSFICRSAQTD